MNKKNIEFYRYYFSFTIAWKVSIHSDLNFSWFTIFPTRNLARQEKRRLEAKYGTNAQVKISKINP